MKKWHRWLVALLLGVLCGAGTVAISGNLLSDGGESDRPDDHAFEELELQIVDDNEPNSPPAFDITADDAYYEFGPFPDGPPQQRTWRMDKVGVDARVVAAYPDRKADFEAIRNAKAGRLDYITNELNKSIPEDQYWHSIVQRVTTHGGETCYQVIVTLKKPFDELPEREPMGTHLFNDPDFVPAFVFDEYWKIGEIGSPQLVERINY